MFGNRYFAPRYFADRFYPPGSTVVVEPEVSGGGGMRQAPFYAPRAVRGWVRLVAPAAEVTAIGAVLQPVLVAGHIVSPVPAHQLVAIVEQPAVARRRAEDELLLLGVL